MDDINNYERKLKELSGENDNLRRQMKEQEYSYSQKYEVEVTRKYQMFEQNIANLTR